MRRWLQNPYEIVAPYVKAGMTVLDIGCGPGFFSIEIARLVGPGGKVISADVQEGMLEELGKKVRGTSLEERIKCVKCERTTINVSDMVDFILAFYMVHEVPDKNTFFRQLRSVLKEHGELLLVEPKLFHVSRKAFQQTTAVAEKSGFKFSPGPKLRFSWSALFKAV
ncbi:MAG: class I SAM-dependent methyltransferase [Bacteroidota bacterium]